ncbi:MAG: paraquat-inducible protein A [Opitutaceae bacterium]|jgi:paraquat-inducible protein A
MTTSGDSSASFVLTTRRRFWAAVLLTGSLACNIAVLMLPFMQLRVGLSQSPYSLLSSVDMLWSSGLYVLAILVVAFSVVFPFAKLGVLLWLCAHREINARRLRWLTWVERFGKWSMLDVFLVCLILALTSGQFLVGSTPLVGIPVFVAAIMLSMAGGELLSVALPFPPSPPPLKGGVFAGGGGWLTLSGLALAGTIGLPFLRIHDWLLADNSYSIVTIVPTLMSKAVVPAVITGAFLIFTPLAAWIASCVWWLRLRNGQTADAAYRHMLLWRRWSMLDVFGLALAIFLVEGDYLMNTEVRWGALALVALLGLQRVLQAALDRTFRRAAENAA